MFVFCGLFDDAVSSSDYIVLDERMINEWWIRYDMGGSGRDLT
jgi:hypothetical protein